MWGVRDLHLEDAEQEKNLCGYYGCLEMQGNYYGLYLVKLGCL